jgi:hypothetical protein
MLNPSQQQKIARKCAAALCVAIDAFPKLLASSEVEAAAAIVADLIKTQLQAPTVAEDPMESLGEIMRRAHAETDARPKSDAT